MSWQWNPLIIKRECVRGCICFLSDPSFKTVPLAQNVRARACFRPSQAH
jgi:hypothetical protein